MNRQMAPPSAVAGRLAPAIVLCLVLAACASSPVPAIGPSAQPVVGQPAVGGRVGDPASGSPESAGPLIDAPDPGSGSAAPPGAAGNDPTASNGPLDAGTPAGTRGTVRLMAVGDLMLARSVGNTLLAQPNRPLRDVTAIFSKADLVIGNLECAISSRGSPVPKHFRFRAPPVAAAALSHAGLDIAAMANNHSTDYGRLAMTDTMSLLAAQGIAHVGAGADRAAAYAPLVLVRNGLRVAFLDYLAVFSDSTGWSAFDWEARANTPGLALGRLKDVAAGVRAARKVADVVVVMYHAGIEGSSTPSGVERRIASTALSAGASLVIGAHPHILQGTSRDQDTFIAYSLGNFVFDLSRGASNDSAVLDVTLTAAGVTAVRWVPVELDHSFPRPATPTERARIRARLRPIA
jgi:poly-gamma-glutamate capsule biosynthesis protein CapA/YwtB (metallophosphatase superfamily)